MGSRALDVEVFRCPFRDNAVNTCTKEFETAAEARQHLNKEHQGKTVDVDFLVKIKTTPYPDFGKFLVLSSCRAEGGLHLSQRRCKIESYNQTYPGATIRIAGTPRQQQFPIAKFLTYFRAVSGEHENEAVQTPNIASHRRQGYRNQY